jgi:antirestriction protein ArdC
MKTNWHVVTAAEAIAALQFARFGFDVSVQYGANQPEYDLMVTDGEEFLKIKVLKNDKRAIFTAASHAQRAVDFLHGAPKAAQAA